MSREAERRRIHRGVAECEAQHPARRTGSDAQAQLDDLMTFPSPCGDQRPAAERHRSRARPSFYRWSLPVCDPGTVRGQATQAYYFLTDIDPSCLRNGRTSTFAISLPTLWAISIHEVYPGHFLHYQHLRQVESKARKSILFSPASFVEGWAHYCEQMMLEAGFRREDQTLRLGQLAEALIRLARFVVAIRLHAEDMSVEQGVRIFRDESVMEEGGARREAERGTFDPTYLVYSVGKLMLLKLRRDYQEQMGKSFLFASSTIRCCAMAPRPPGSSSVDAENTTSRL